MCLEKLSVGELGQNVPLVRMELVARVVPHNVKRTFVQTHGRRKFRGDLARLVCDIVALVIAHLKHKVGHITIVSCKIRI